jgi:membrane protease YdiL (CAAX protease family)
MMDSAEPMPDNDGQTIPRRGPILWVLLAMIVVFMAAPIIAHPFRSSYWIWPCFLFFYCIMAIVTLALARITPETANFDRRWFPTRWWHWALFVGMLFLLFASGAIVTWLANLLGLKLVAYADAPSTTAVVWSGVILILIAPIAEEVFWRGYVLEQLRKLTNSGAALLAQSLLFGLAHLHLGNGYFAMMVTFVHGLILGTWRIRFRSLIPLILAHMILNGLGFIAIQGAANREAVPAERAADSVRAWEKKYLSNPKCQQIRALTGEPAQKAVPGLIGFFSDPDDDVRTYAETILTRYYRRDAEPYMRESLSSRDNNVLDAALWVIGQCGYSGYKQEVRDIAWSSDDLKIQLSATVTLAELSDEEGLRKVAQGHPNETVRRTAEQFLADPYPKPAEK